MGISRFPRRRPPRARGPTQADAALHVLKRRAAVFMLALCVLAACFSLLPCAAGAQEPARAPDAVDVATAPDQLALGQHLQVLEDRDSRFDLQRLRSEPHPWTKPPGDALSFGFSRSTWWARMVLRNGGGAASSPVLDLGAPLQDWMDIHVVRGDGAHVETFLAGDRRPFGRRPVPTRVPCIPLRLAAGEQIEVYVRLATHDGLHEAVPLRLWQHDAFLRHQETETLALGLYFGALATVLLYNLFLFVATRDRNFGLYVAYVFAFLMWGLVFRGFAFQYAWPESPDFGNRILPVAAASCYLTFAMFMMSYLETRRHSPPWLHRTLLFAACGNGLCIVPGVLDFYTLSFAASLPFGVLLMVSALWAGFRMLRAGSRPARYFLIAFTLLAAGVMLYYLRLVGAVRPTILTEYGLQIGSVLEVLLLAFGLADQMNTLKSEKLQVEREALAAQTALTGDLERQVELRTAALADANARLADLAITDELTGAFNRRHFTAAFETAVALHRRHRAPLAFCLLDIDHFKLYNDRYGHPAGDAVLQQVSLAVTRQLGRAGDLFFRVGGEEFGILMAPDEPPQGVERFVERIRASIEALGIAHAGNPHGVVTASFGLVLLTRGAEPMQHPDVYAAADRLLYEAKHAGRNRVFTLTL